MGGWCALTVAASPSLLFVGWDKMRLRPGVANAGTAGITGRTGEGGCAVAFRLVGVAGTTPAVRGIVAAGTCAAGLAAAAYVGGGAGNAVAADGGGEKETHWLRRAVSPLHHEATKQKLLWGSGRLLDSRCRKGSRFRKGLPWLGRPKKDKFAFVLQEKIRCSLDA
eukprot:1137619-Pelagomonas_calceolata.AAC.9